ncbi:MAG: [FeFe] hydrogenase H-cluster radical SAM maturase HydE [Candidatus Neomarinimicrobiota bacterium]|nr:[FeFe] hydrogenase H-cluster radical SAM maturase HydE [bacterium]
MRMIGEILRQELYTEAELLQLLLLQQEADQKQLFASADRLTRSIFGRGIYLRGIIEISNICRRNCNYCGIRAANIGLTRYRMQPKEILQSVKDIRDAGIRTVVLQSGEDPYFTPEMVETLIHDIRSKYRMAITLSLGEYPFSVYRRWHAAGADRYLLKFESSDRDLYKKLHPDCDFDERWRCLRDIRRAGYQLGSGFMVGLPGQTPEMLVKDLLALAELEPDMAGIGPFIPHPQTPLNQSSSGDPLLTLKVLALARLILKNTHLPTTTALETLEHDSRIRGLQAGANVIMPNYTPEKYKKFYDIYPNKAGSTGSAQSTMQTIRDQVRDAGRFIKKGYGHSLKETYRTLK